MSKVLLAVLLFLKMVLQPIGTLCLTSIIKSIFQGASKIEKAEILEMTVEYVRKLIQSDQCNNGKF